MNIFLQNALIAGIAISITCSLLGVFLVQRKMSFLGSGLSHSALGGIGLAILLGIEPMYVALPFTVLVSLLITLVNERTKLEMDTSIGILFSAATALGIIFIAQSSGYVGDAYSYLFGSILGVTPMDIVVAIAFTAITIAFMWRYWEELAYSTFDAELALSDNVHIRRNTYLLHILLAIAIVVAMKIIGIVLCTAFLTLPAAIARVVAGTFTKMTLIAVVVGIATTVVGMFVSFLVDFPSGATIIVVQSLVFGVCMVVKR
ncbi:MAG: metal ABC transporter permease [Ignavibacteria bacterium]|jgi:zinc transport system permease protein|nr:metal ABC transporter permease [Ignavibacteria bacterium]